MKALLRIIERDRQRYLLAASMYKKGTKRYEYNLGAADALEAVLHRIALLRTLDNVQKMHKEQKDE